VLTFTAQVNNPIIKPADDVADYKFFSKKNIPFEKLAFPSITQALRDYLSSSQ
jgi:hypothetical protein